MLINIGQWLVDDGTLRSQHQQDQYVFRNSPMARAYGPANYFDIGAYDGFRLSNTWALEHAGWRGVCVEPSRWYGKLVGKRGENNKLVNKAVWTRNGQIRMVENGMLSHAEDVPGDATEMVECDTLYNIIRDTMRENGSKTDPFPMWGYLSVDIEGCEFLVMKKFFSQNKSGKPEDKSEFRIVSLEWRDHNKLALINLMQAHGYVHTAELGTDLMFKHITVAIGNE